MDQQVSTAEKTSQSAHPQTHLTEETIPVAASAGAQNVEGKNGWSALARGAPGLTYNSWTPSYDFDLQRHG
jgi:hypothetical protein